MMSHSDACAWPPGLHYTWAIHQATAGLTHRDNIHVDIHT